MDDLQITEKQQKQRISWVMLTTLLWGLAAHGYCYFNLTYSHDSLLVFQNDGAEQISLGRFLHPIYCAIRGEWYTPALVGALSLLFLGLTGCVLAAIFHMNHRGSLCLLTGILVTNAAMTLLNATYIHDVDLYALALLLAVLAVYLCRRFRYGIFPAVVCICCSLAIYQSFFQAAVFLFLIAAVLDILKQKKLQRVLTDGIRAIGTLLVGLGLYYGILQIVLRVTGAQLATTYNGISTVGKFDGAGAVLELLVQTYQYVWEYFRAPATTHAGITGALNMILLVLTVLLAAVIVWKRHIRGNELALLLVLTLLMPFGMNVIYVIAKGVEHDLMIYSFFFAYLLTGRITSEFFRLEAVRKALARLRKGLRQGIRYAVPALLAVILFNSVVYANQVYLKKDLEYRSTQLTMNRILDRMEQTEGYVVGETPVVLVGTLSASPLSVAREGFDNTEVGLGQSFSVTYDMTYQRYFDYILAYPINLRPSKEAAEYAAREDVQSMSAFPAADCCQLIEGVLVVKLSE